MKDILTSSSAAGFTSWEIFLRRYKQCLNKALDHSVMDKIPLLCQELKSAWEHNRQVFICGNGGSAGNAIHMANDFLYGAGGEPAGGLMRKP